MPQIFPFQRQIWLVYQNRQELNYSQMGSGHGPVPGNNGTEVRALIGQIEQQGIYLLAEQLYKERGITANQDWIRNTMGPVLSEAYPQELAESAEISGNGSAYGLL